MPGLPVCPVGLPRVAASLWKARWPPFIESISEEKCLKGKEESTSPRTEESGSHLRPVPGEHFCPALSSASYMKGREGSDLSAAFDNMEDSTLETPFLVFHGLLFLFFPGPTPFLLFLIYGFPSTHPQNLEASDLYSHPCSSSHTSPLGHTIYSMVLNSYYRRPSMSVPCLHLAEMTCGRWPIITSYLYLCIYTMAYIPIENSL